MGAGLSSPRAMVVWGHGDGARPPCGHPQWETSCQPLREARRQAREFRSPGVCESCLSGIGTWKWCELPGVGKSRLVTRGDPECTAVPCPRCVTRMSSVAGGPGRQSQPSTHTLSYPTGRGTQPSAKAESGARSREHRLLPRRSRASCLQLYRGCSWASWGRYACARGSPATPLWGFPSGAQLGRPQVRLQPSPASLTLSPPRHTVFKFLVPGETAFALRDVFLTSHGSLL